MGRARFHLAFAALDLVETEAFYVDVLGCEVGRRAETWIDFNLGGNQLSAHVSNAMPTTLEIGNVDDVVVPIPHFGLILSWKEWEGLAERLVSKSVEFRIEPQVRYQGEPAEQATMFLSDPSGNHLEFKAFRDEAHIFE